jgi:hypothetical protein
MASSSQRSARDSADTSDTKRSSSQKGAGANRRASTSKSTSRATPNTSSRSRARSGNSSSGGSGSSAGSSRGNAQSRSGGRSRSGSSGSRSDASTSSGTTSRGSSTKGKAARAGSGVKSVVLPVATAVGGAAIGVIGGAVLNRKSRPKRKVLGVSVPRVGVGPDLEKLARQIGDAAGQFGRLAGEVHAAREQAAKIGKALS